MVVISDEDEVKVLSDRDEDPFNFDTTNVVVLVELISDNEDSFGFELPPKKRIKRDHTPDLARIKYVLVDEILEEDYARVDGIFYKNNVYPYTRWMKS